MKRSAMAVILAAFAALSIFGFFWRAERNVLPAAQTSAAARGHIPVPVIDPGHGGPDGGATSLTGLPESRINLEIGLKTELMMRFLGLTPVMTRETDISIHDPDKKTIRDQKVSDIHNRVKIVNGTPNGVLISIHQNLFEQSRYSGAQVFYNGAENKALAETAQALLRESLDPGNNRQAKEADFYLLKNAKKPAIMVECGFLSNMVEETLLRSPVYQRKLALVFTALFARTALCRCEVCECADCGGFCGG